MLDLAGLVKHYEGRRVVDGVSLAAAEGTLLALLGPSGCGKTTTLRIVAGHERPDEGRVRIGGEDVTDRPPERRDVGMVFQGFALFPHLSVFGNVAFGLRCRKVPRDEERRRVAEVLDLVGLGGTGTRSVTTLSGGERQRVALARALVLRPRLLLLDEPLSNLDAALRGSTRREIRRIQRETGVTALYVTHDQEEALAIADRIAVMEGGRVRQEGTPLEVYSAPATPFVASFLGDANVLRGRVADGRFTAEGGLALETPGAPDGPAAVAVRREAVRLVPGTGAVVTERQFLGEIWSVRVRAGETDLNARRATAEGVPPEPGAETGIEIAPADVRILGEAP